MLLRRYLLPLAVFVSMTSMGHVAYAVKATEGRDVVLNKKYPKKKSVEVDFKAGAVLNGSYVDTILYGASLTYFSSEEYGWNLEFMGASAEDRSERKCIENFYNDPEPQQVGRECAPDGNTGDDLEGTTNRANMGPAYVPIRELNSLIFANLVWNPLYGKQIILLSAVSYFDLFITMGGGIAQSTFYPQALEFQDGSGDTRGKFPEDTSQPTPGTDPGNTHLYGEAGRPPPEEQTHFALHFALGQRFHFGGRFMFNAEIKDMLLLGTPSGFDNFVSILGGLGVRF